MSDYTPPTDAMVEAGAQAAFFTDDVGGHIRGDRNTWESISEIGRSNYRAMVRSVLTESLAAEHRKTETEGK